MNENITKTTAETENNTNETTQAAPPRLTLDVTPETRLYVGQLDDLLLKVSECEANSGEVPENAPDWERLRYTLFQCAFKEVVDGVHQCLHVLNGMDEKYLAEMCDKAGVTMKRAYENARMNLMASMLPPFLRELFKK